MTCGSNGSERRWVLTMPFHSQNDEREADTSGETFNTQDDVGDPDDID